MNWLQQAVHVAKKDLRMSRWFLAVYVITVIAAIPAALGENYGWTVFAPLIVTLSGLLYTAFVVQADSAYRPDAYWATKPLHRTAVWAGKVLFVLAVPVTVAIAAKAAALFLGFDTRGELLFEQVRQSATLYAGLLLLAIVLASITSDLRTFLLAGVLYLVALNVLAYFTHNVDVYDVEVVRSDGSGTGISKAAVSAVFTFITLLLPAHVYATRTRRIATGVIVAGMLVMLVLPGEGVGRGVTEPRAHSAPPANIATPVLRAVPHEGIVDNPGELSVRVKLDREADQYLYVLRTVAAEIHLPDGSIERVDSSPRSVALGDPIPPTINGVTWLIDRPRTGGGLQMAITQRHHELILNRTGTLKIHGYIDVLAREEVFAIPAQEGSAVVRDGTRLKIQKIETIGRKISIQAGTATVNQQGFEDMPWLTFDNAVPYALVNKASGRAIMLRPRGGRNTGTGVVLPGGYSMIGTTILEIAPSRMTDTTDFRPDLLNGAELVHYRWRNIGSFPASAELTFAPMPVRN